MFAVFGADGFFGTYIQKYLLCAFNEKILAFNHRGAVFTDKRIINLPFELCADGGAEYACEQLSRYDDGDIKILYLIAAHNPDFLKKSPERGAFINRELYGRFLNGVDKIKIHSLFYASSDTVYGEGEPPEKFSETGAAHPINEYGRQKLEAEKITLEHGFSAARFPYLSAPSLTPYKKHFFDETAEKLRRGEQVKMLTDFIRSAISYSEAARLLCRTAQTDFSGVINICADSAVSKYEIGLEIAKHISADKSLVLPVTSKQLGIFKEKRAVYIAMDNSRLKNLLNEKNITMSYGD